jgi:hypothetical protein
MEMVQGGDVAHNPNLIAVQEHNFACLLIQVAEIGLVVELVSVGDARGEVRR